jgi:hypothetical protein
MYIWRTLTDRSLKLLCLLVIPAVLLLAAPPVFASNDPLDARFDKISTSEASVVATHQLGFDISNVAVPVGSISFEFCQNTPIIGDVCDPPSGLDTSGAVLSSQSGSTGFTIDPSSTNGHIILTRPPALPVAGPSRYIFDNFINPDTSRTYYVRIQTFTSTDATGSDIESGGVTFYIIGHIDVTAEVPPYLKFCAAVTITAFDCSTATSFLIDFGEFSRTIPSAGTSEFVAATNAAFGYSVSVNGTTLISGTSIIPALYPASGSVTGTSQFGMNLKANTSPVVGIENQGPGIATATAGYNLPNLFGFQNGDTVATSTGSTDNNKFTVSYIVNINSAQPAGFYATTMTYICLANF